jgi:hypothetical protein
MWTLRIGMAEAFLAASVAALMALVVVAFAAGWPIALIPAITYGLAVVAIYKLAKAYARDEAEASQPLDAVARFEVVEVRGRCQLGRHTGDVIKVGPAGSVTPVLCPDAERVLRQAANMRDARVDQWCCPIYDHMLVFRRVAPAA